MKTHKHHAEGFHPTTRTQWVVVGDASRFLIYERARKNLSQLKTFTNQTTEHESDSSPSSLDQLLRQVALFVEKGCGEKAFDDLVLITSARLLGKLRPLLSKHTQTTVTKECTKDLAWISGAALENRIETLLALE